MNRSMQTASRSTPPRQSIASYATYAEAQRAVDYLSDNKFPVEHTAIVAEGLRFVEEVTGRLNWWRAAINGAGSGALIGLLIGLFFALFTPGAVLLSLSLSGLVTGLVIGAVLGLVGYLLTGGRRDFTSVGGMQAESYDVMVDIDKADEAMRLLEGMR